MSSLKTLLAAFLFLPFPAFSAEHALVKTFATCVGRYSAELEHAWLMNDDGADKIEHRRARLISLLDATVPDDDRRQVLHLRIDAKMAHASLLTAAVFSKDTDRAQWALQRAKSEIAFCSSFLLES